MSIHWFELLSGLASFVFCALLAAVSIRTKLRALLARPPARVSGPYAAADSITQAAPKNHTQDSRLGVSLTACAALFAFLWIPLGSLPALFPFRWGGLAALGCLGLALGFAEDWRWNGAMRSKACALVLIGLSLAFFSWHARQRGAPGELFSLDSYVATPVVSFIVMSWSGALGIALLALAFLGSVRDVQIDLLSGLAQVARLEADEARTVVITALTRQIWILAVLGVALCLFVPFCPATWLGLSGVTGVAVDALVFWLKVLLVDYALWLAADRFPHQPAWLSWARMLLAGLGALCLLFA
jgi:hypothetical protein